MSRGIQSVVPLLSPADRNSPLWLKLKKHFEKRLEDLRAKNEGELGIDETNRYRGRIAEIKALIALDKDPIELN